MATKDLPIAEHWVLKMEADAKTARATAEGALSNVGKSAEKMISDYIDAAYCLRGMATLLEVVAQCCRYADGLPAKLAVTGADREGLRLAEVQDWPSREKEASNA